MTHKGQPIINFDCYLLMLNSPHLFGLFYQMCEIAQLLEFSKETELRIENLYLDGIMHVIANKSSMEQMLFFSNNFLNNDQFKSINPFKLGKIAEKVLEAYFEHSLFNDQFDVKTEILLMAYVVTEINHWLNYWVLTLDF